MEHSYSCLRHYPGYEDVFFTMGDTLWLTRGEKPGDKSLRVLAIVINYSRPVFTRP